VRAGRQWSVAKRQTAKAAMQMLTSGELLVKEVAFKIGYQNPSHFISAFKKKYGYTPKQFLKRETVSDER
jgi:AraC-like DNA-binding protein